MFTKSFWDYGLMCTTSPDDLESGSSGEGSHGGSTGPHISATTDDGKTALKINEHGYPENTPVEQMAPEQQAAYWKYHARKHEKRSKDREDYDQLKAKLEQYEQSQMTDAEKQIQQAREDGEAEAAKRFQSRMVETTLRAHLGSRGLDEEAIIQRLSFIDNKAFLTSDGEVDSDKVNAYLEANAPQGKQQHSWPDMGGGNRNNGNMRAGGSLQAGADLYAEKHANK